MANRFGRNQRRKLRTTVESLEMALACEKSFRQQSDARNAEKLRRIEADADYQIRAARMARDTIRIDVDALIDDRDRQIRMRARFDNLSKAGPELYAAYSCDADTLLRDSRIERDAFIKLVGEQIAGHALEQITRHWRSRP